MGSQDALFFSLYNSEKMLFNMSQNTHDLNHTESHPIFGALAGTIQELYQLANHI